MQISIGLSLTGRARRGTPPIISAVTAPALAPLLAGDTIASGLSADIDQTTNYTSTAGTITSVVVDVLVNGETPASLDIPLDFEDVVSVTVTVTDSEANVRVFSLGRTVAGVAPTNDVAPSISGTAEVGATLTRTEGTYSGNPTPTLSGQWQRDGVDITGETGATYEVVSDDQGADITYRETATNAVGSVSVSSNAIAIPEAPVATVPDAFTAPDWDVANDGDTVSVNILTLPSDGGAPITDLEYRVNGGTAISLGETTTGSYPITAVEGDDIEIRAVNAIGAGDWSDVKAVPAAASGVQATGGTETVINPSAGEFYRVHTFLTSGDLTVTQGGDVEYLVVAGGGAGGNYTGGGGGAGGFLSGAESIASNVYSIVVGAGAPRATTERKRGENGQNTTAIGLTAIGGGAGGSLDDTDGLSGGSGGAGRGSGLGGAGTSGQGFAGGNGSLGLSGGGGGASEPGYSGDATSNGGDGVQSNINGIAVYYAGGGGGYRDGTVDGFGGLGGGGNSNNLSDASTRDAMANTGGGGGGGGGSSGRRVGGAGGSGIVIIRYPITEAEYNAEVA
jgi:hypothetical protein